jgi:hypothetical protein
MKQKNKKEQLMEIKKTWSASSKFEQTEKGEDLFYLAGRWGIGIDVKITRPFLYSHMSVAFDEIEKRERTGKRDERDY